MSHIRTPPTPPENAEIFNFRSLEERNAIRLALMERDHQDNKWGGIENFDIRSPHQWLTILMEEVGELAEAALKRDDAGVDEEAVQVAAVALAIIESHERKHFSNR